MTPKDMTDINQDTARPLRAETHGTTASSDDGGATPRATTKGAAPRRQSIRKAKLRAKPKRDAPSDTAASPAEVHFVSEAHARPDLRWADERITAIREQWRMRQDMVRAMNRLILQAKANLRRLCEGDKAKATALYNKIAKGIAADEKARLKGRNSLPTEWTREMEQGRVVVAPLLAAIEPLQATRTIMEKALEKKAKELPVAHFVEKTAGFGFAGLAAIVGEAGDLSAYKSVSAVWKRLGVAVIDGERQRKCSDLDKALLHGYSPARRSVLWTIADSMFKAQTVQAGTYRQLYDRKKAEALAKEWPPIRADRHARRLMSKELVKRLTLAWREAALNRDAIVNAQTTCGPHLLAAE